MENEKLTNSLVIAELLRRHTQGESLSEEETVLLSRWRGEQKENEELFSKLQNSQELAHSLYEIGQTDTEARLQDFKQSIRKRKQTKQLYRIAAIAASILLVISFGLYRFTNSESGVAEVNEFTSEYGGDALPASNRAILTLSSGKVMELRDDQKGVIADGQGIFYEDGKSIDESADIQYVTLTTPRGGQYNVTLSDGSKVSLNAGSSLEYPLHFAGNERQVKLQGEGYFEIAHNTIQPFVVQTEQQEVKVLGTVFNIQAYSDKETTTLVSGSVSVMDNDTHDETTLQPNTQAIVRNGAIVTRKVDVSDYIGWQEGRFRAELITLRDLSEDIERWYDVRFIYPANYRNNERAYISINRHEKLSAILNVLEMTYGVQFRIHGKEVYIK